MIQELVMAINRMMDGKEDTVSVKLLAKAYDILDRNEATANEYINYQVNYTVNKALKSKVPPPFDEWEDSKDHLKKEKKNYD